MSAASAPRSSSMRTVTARSAWLTTRTRSSSPSAPMSRSRVMPTVRPMSSSIGWTLASGFRSADGLVITMPPRKLPPTEPCSRTGRSPPTRSTEHDSSRVSPWYRPSPRESGWMSPNGVGQQVHVAVLEDLHGAQVGRPGDRPVAGGQERDLARGREVGGGRGVHQWVAHRGPVPSSPPVTAPSRSAWSAMTSASIRSSMSPSMTPGRLCTVLPIRWSVTRSCGKL